jgi:hypothetical protein
MAAAMAGGDGAAMFVRELRCEGASLSYRLELLEGAVEVFATVVVIGVDAGAAPAHQLVLCSPSQGGDLFS